MEKKDIALKQLRAAARLYNEGDYISSLTLSGAADEILGKIAKKRTRTNQFEQNLEFLKGIYLAFERPVPDKKALIQKMNGIKNELKHNDIGENAWVDADFEFETALLFVSAVKNYYSSYNQWPKDRIITRLFDHLTL